MLDAFSPFVELKIDYLHSWLQKTACSFCWRLERLVFAGLPCLEYLAFVQYGKNLLKFKIVILFPLIVTELP